MKRLYFCFNFWKKSKNNYKAFTFKFLSSFLNKSGWNICVKIIFTKFLLDKEMDDAGNL